MVITMAKKVSVKSKRLVIEPMSDDELVTLVSAETDEGLKSAYGDMLAGIRNNPLNALWHTYWKITLKADGTKIGGVCFKGAPNNRHEVEVGYGIDEPYRRQGYAVEALNAMSCWAYSQNNVYFIRAITDEENTVSKRVLEKCKFKSSGSNDEGQIYEREKDASAWMPIYMGIGLGFGLCFGNMFSNPSIGMSLGMSLGLAFGAILDAVDKSKRKRD